MCWNGVYGRTQIIATLQAGIMDDKSAHACLFYGPEGIGKKTLAQAYAAALNCSGPAGGVCGQCFSCRKAAAGSHPDIHWIVPDGKSLKIDQVRRIKKSAYLKPHEGRCQVFVLDGADLLTPEAANSLLKVLEEPPPAVTFILLAQNPSSLPPTIVSRCLLFPMPRLDRQSLARILEEKSAGTPAEEANRFIGQSEGIPGRLLSLAARRGWHNSCQDAIALLMSLHRGGDAGEHADRLAEKENIHDELDTIIYVLRNLLVMQATGDARLLTDRSDAEEMAKLTEKWHPFSTMEAIKAILKLHRDLRSPINARLALERAMRRLKEVLSDADSCGNPL